MAWSWKHGRREGPFPFVVEWKQSVEKREGGRDLLPPKMFPETSQITLSAGSQVPRQHEIFVGPIHV